MDHVNADLVGAAGVNVAEDEGCVCFGIGSEDLVVGDGRFSCAGVDYGHFESVDGVSADVGEDGVLLLDRDSLDDGEVLFFGFAFGELFDEGLVSLVSFCDDDAA